MLCRFLYLLCLLPFCASAQFIYNPLPFKEADFAKINQLKYTKCLVFEMQGEEKVLVKEAEFGNKGLVAALYEKGTNDNGDSINTSTTYYLFDGKGKLIKTTNEDVEMGESIAVHNYDAVGKLLKKMVATIDPPTYTYKYDAKGKLIQVNCVQRFPSVLPNGDWDASKPVDRLTYKSTFKYNAKGQLSEEWIYQVSGKESLLLNKLSWTYDANGRVANFKRLNAEGGILNESSYEYNSDGLLTKSTEMDSFTEEKKVFVYEYNRDKQSWK